jgi:DNA ligase-1
MRLFSELFLKLDQSNKTSDKINALKDFFRHARDEDRVWALAFFTHRRPKRQVNTRQLRTWCCEKAGIADWLFEESYQSVGDLAETISLLLPEPSSVQDMSLADWANYLVSMEKDSEDTKRDKIFWAWDQLNKDERFIFNKIITGGFRVGVSQMLVTQAVAEVFRKEKSEITHRLMGDWNPITTHFGKLLLDDLGTTDGSKPYPFCLAHPLDTDIESLGSPGDWLVEWKWDGIRGQIIHRHGEIHIWSRGEELVTDKFPELVAMAKKLPNGTVLDGEILAFQNGIPLPFAVLQKRIGRKSLGKKILQEAPVAFIAYDVLEWEKKDFRDTPLSNRRLILDFLKDLDLDPLLIVSEKISGESWEELAKKRSQARSMMAEGMMLKRISSTYEIGRKRGAWWKWKIEPISIDGVMVYAQKGHGRRADLYSDYTLAVWEGDRLVPFAKAYSGLTDAEMREVDRYVKNNTVEKFGPVRTVKPGLVFEIAFEGIQESSRHKSGIALRFPRIQRWRKDKPIQEANTLQDLKDLLKAYGK